MGHEVCISPRNWQLCGPVVQPFSRKDLRKERQP